MELIERIDAARERWNVLEHPFYKRWSCGELTRGELAHYAGEYRHAVVALADTAKKTGHEEHAREETEHVGLWDEFVAAFGAKTDRKPSAETAECVDAWTAPENRHEALAVMYAIEAGQPAGTAHWPRSPTWHSSGAGRSSSSRSERATTWRGISGSTAKTRSPHCGPSTAGRPGSTWRA